MSLFTLRDVWSFPSAEAGSGSISVVSIAVANIDNNEEGRESVIIGTDSGILRILAPPVSASVPASSSASDAKGRLLAEFQLGSAILQVAVGHLLGGSPDLQLAILHPQRFSVYGFSRLGGRVEHGSEYKVTVLYEHALKRHAFNMVIGPFGQTYSKPGGGLAQGHGPTRRDYSCIQSLDGTLSFFEQEVVGFSRHLPNFLLPGPLAFVSSTNSFLTVTSAWDLQCYRYVTLAGAAQIEERSEGTVDADRGRSLKPEWVCSLGEEPIGEIHVLGGGGVITRIVILTFRLLFCFNDEGQILWTKRLDFPLGPSMAYLNTAGEPITVLTSAAETATLYLFNATSLKWAVKLQSTPIALSRIRLERDVPGGLVMLGLGGDVGVFVLGTEPSLFIAPPITARDLDYDEAEKELQALRRIIADAGEQGVVGGRDKSVEMKVEFEGQKRIWMERTESEGIALLATVKILCHVRVNDVRVTILTAHPLICSSPTVYVGDIVGRHSFAVEFYAGSDSVPCDLECEVTLFYISDSERPHCIQKRGLRIPLFVIAKAHDEVDKEGEAKITLTLNKPLQSLGRLYNDFDWNAEVNAWGLTFAFQGGEHVSLLASTKGNTETSSKYRLQSDSLPALNLLLRDFIERIQRKFGREGGYELGLLGQENQIPLLNEYFEEIEGHVLRRRRQLQIKEDVSGRAAQLRGIQRRLLIRFRDKNPQPMTQLETLLEGSLEQILDALNFMDQNQLEIEKSECRLAGATRLIIALCLIQCGRSVDEGLPTRNALCPSLEGLSEEYGWEEIVYSGLCYMKTEDAIRTPSFAQLEMKKLKKVIKSRFESLKKLGNSDDTAKQGGKIQPSPAPQPQDLKGNEIIERMMSAKSRADKNKNPNLVPHMPSIPEPTADGED